jgi:predicted type IV restriction endonuclease
MSCPDEILHLVERFQLNLEAYRSGQYNETQLRREFLDPFFSALGWDVENKQGYAEAYKDVIHEDAIKVGGATKAPDYCFRIGGTRKFFVEAKKPSVNLRDEISPAYQLRRYAWSAKLPLSILTDFDEFAVYDCRAKPGRADTAATARTLYVEFKEYPERWEEISSIFSRDAVLKGSFDRYAESTKAKKGTAEVDDAFLKEIESWRDTLARTIALRNTDLTQRQLNSAVQRTIDRMIFLRICEDRGIETYGALMALLNGEHVYKRLCELFHRADEKYNSGLFHFRLERDRLEKPDELTLSLSIDDKPLKEIIRNLYYPDSPYEFSVLPADILGQVYEQFLGKVIRLTAGHRAVVEDKPEVKKAGGVYYTPTYIVDYIVKNTVGALLNPQGRHPAYQGHPELVSGSQERMPKQVRHDGKPVTPKEVSKLRILDPACGSGSFLIGAYQYLLDWHRDWYLNDGAKKWATGRSPVLYQVSGADWRLTTAERKRILLNNIYGVDIDPQAVEVTKLSLLLKVLEGENEQTISRQLKMFHERALPDLGNNIKCGNSLIGPDFYEGKQLSLMDDEERLRINVFDWKKEFPFLTPSVLRTSPPSQGGDIEGVGFDAVIGNPPYVFGRDWKALGISDEVKQYLGRRYTSSPYQLDMFSIFIEKAFQVCCLNGFIGQIVPNVWLNNTYSVTTRSLVLGTATDIAIVVPASPVFRKITVDTVVYCLKKSGVPGTSLVIKSLSTLEVKDVATLDSEIYLDGKRPISVSIDSAGAGFLARLHKSYSRLGSFADITRGVHPYRIGGYGKSAFSDGPQTLRDLKERPYHSLKQKSGYRPFIYGKDLKRFTPPVAREFVRYGDWLAEPRSAEYFEGERVYSRKILGDRLVVTVETVNSVADQQVYITKPRDGSTSALYLAGILGSRLISYFVRRYYSETDQAFPQIKVTQLKDLPIPVPTTADKSRHDRIVEMVEQMLALHKQLASGKTEHEKTALQRQIDATDKQIDQLVYELYGLSEEEMKIVEGAPHH